MSGSRGHALCCRMHEQSRATAPEKQAGALQTVSQGQATYPSSIHGPIQVSAPFPSSTPTPKALEFPWAAPGESPWVSILEEARLEPTRLVLPRPFQSLAFKGQARKMWLPEGGAGGPPALRCQLEALEQVASHLGTLVPSPERLGFLEGQ